MADEAKRRKAIKAGISESDKELKQIIAKRRKIISATITRYTSMPNYTKSATVRDKLYNELRKEYKAFNSDINGWTLKNSNKQAKESRRFAIEDLPAGEVTGTFNEFSRKHMDDIIGAINPATVDKQVAINAKIGGMLDRDIQILRQTVSKVIAQGVVEGLSGPEMSQRMISSLNKQSVGQFQFIDKAGRRWTADNYFGMLNRTLGSTVARESYNAQVTDSGYDLAQIEGGQTVASLTNPNDPCSRWAGKIISLTGATNGYPTYQDAINDGMFHPNCCMPETEVDTCDLKAVSRFKYSGEVIKIEFASGNSLTVTPNHKLLTDQGFSSANALANGDNVLRRIKGKGLCASSPNINRNPSTIKEVFMSLRKSLGVPSCKVPVSAKDFHGDGEFGNGDISIIHADSLLLDDFKAGGLLEEVGENGFVFADSKLLKFSGCGASNFLLYAVSSATNRIMSGFSICGSPFSSSELLSKRKLLTFASNPYACGNKGFMNSVLGNLEHFTNFPVSDAGFIELDYVVNINRLSFSGHVYDLQSLSTLYYANDYLSSNCVHFTSVVIPSDITESKVQELSEDKQGQEMRLKANKERKDDDQKPAKYAGKDGKVSTSG